MYFYILEERSRLLWICIFYPPLSPTVTSIFLSEGVVRTKEKQKCCREKEKPQGPPSLFFCKLKWHTVILKVNTYLQWETFCSGSPVQRISLNYGNKHRGSFIIAQTRTRCATPASVHGILLFIFFLSWSGLRKRNEMELNIILVRERD